MLGIAINIIFTIIMVGLALWDYLSYGKEKHRDFKSIIMSAGVLGTFVGIFIGLLSFNTSDIESSVPLLLEGLKTAFYTSILGMGLAILLSIIQKSKATKSDFENTLDYFSHQATKLDSLSDLRKIVDLTQKGQDLEREKYKDYINLQEKNFTMLKNEFSTINLTLKEAMHHLAQGASKELISALEGVIKDFNQRITEQFGDNFKELNTAVLKLIAWQESYKDTIYGIEETLKDTLKAFDTSKETLSLIAQRNSEVLEVYNALAHSIEASRIENEKLSSLLSGFDNMHTNANNALLSVDSLIKSIESAQSLSSDYTKNSLQSVSDFLKEGSNQTKEYAQSSMQNLRDFLQNSTQENKENIKQVLEENASAFNTMQEVLQTNTQEAKNFTKESLESIAEFLIEGSNQTKEYAQNTTQNIKEFLEQNLQETKEALKEHTKEALTYTKDSANNLTDFLINSNKQYRENAQELLSESTRILNEKHTSFSQNLINLQNEFSDFNAKYITQNKENLKELLSTLQEDITHFIDDFDTSNKEIKGKNLELLNHLKENMQNATQNIQIEFSNALDSLNTAQLQSLTLLENQAKQSDEILHNHAQNIKDDFLNTTDFLKELSQNTKEHLQNNANTLQEKITNSTLSIDALIQNSTKSLQENFLESKNTLQDLSLELKNTFIDNAKNLKESTQNIENSLTNTSKNLSENLQAMLENNEKYSTNINENILNSSQIFTNSLQEILQAQKNFQEENQNQIRQDIAKSYKTALDSISAFFKNSFNTYQAQLTKSAQTQLDEAQSTQAKTLLLQQQMQQDLQNRLNTLTDSIHNQSAQVLENMQGLTAKLISTTNSQLGEHTTASLKHFNALQGRLEKTLSDMATNYTQMLESLTKQSIEMPKNVSTQLLDEFNKLQQNLGQAIEKTFQSLEANRKEIDTILKITQENISHTLTQTSSLNTNLCQSLGELDNSLSDITLGFRQDYEWFLRRIRELMGARN